MGAGTSGYNGPHRAKEVIGVNLGAARHTNEKAIYPEYRRIDILYPRLEV